MRNIVVVALLPLLLGSLSSCSSDLTFDTAAPVAPPEADAADAAADSPGPEADADAAQETDAPKEAGPASLDDVDVAWTPCSLHEGEDDGLAECAETKMPLFWAADDGRTFTVGAKRLLAAGQATRQLWLLHGGPGASGVIGFPPWMEQLRADNPDMDVYTLDPRGSGYSEFTDCPEQEAETSDGAQEITPAEVPACAAHLESTMGDALATIGTTSAAYDLAAFIHHTREPGKRVLIWGGSGGTFWGQRFLQLFPQGADGVVLEGIEPADGSIGLMDAAAISVGRELLSRCREDEVCGAKLPDPEGTLADLYTRLDEGHCPIGIDSTMLRMVIDYLEYYGPIHGLIPSLIYRLDRCASADVQALIALFDVLFSQEDEPRSFSTVLFWNEMCSELWEHERFADNAAYLAYLDGVYEDKLLGTGKGYVRNDIYLAWPRYQDALDDQWAQTEVPLLMLQGVLDPATPHVDALRMKDHFTGPGQTFLSFPNAAHNVMGATPDQDDPSHADCGQGLFYAFLADPGAKLDTSCSTRTMPVDFVGDQGLAAYLYGTADYFENVPAAQMRSEKLVQGRLAVDLRMLSWRLRRAFGGRVW